MQFNPKEWIPEPVPVPRVPVSAGPAKFSGNRNFDSVLQQIERRGVDIAPTYELWRNLGFSLAAEFGESGRDYFHRLSRFYSGYAAAKTDKQYSRCMRGKQGITISSFYYMAKNAGIKI